MSEESFGFGKVNRRHFVRGVLSSGSVAFAPVLETWGLQEL